MDTVIQIILTEREHGSELVRRFGAAWPEHFDGHTFSAELPESEGRTKAILQALTDEGLRRRRRRYTREATPRRS